ncbi:hypothetical protein Q428_11615 [Fervidicella metallireducens AeB]|uniref:LysM domain-containing protein n=1 Tax=Fervidicella metallireducens AeB TaxID=1403537 RepID=A0A017RUZ8_9CLOT|nr:peptidoglycan-binding protein [Fervidicella metallireducens]EYE87735.1 hypothetical protein Q428_11615 [Fervidicella metallireducens AeB]
MIKKIVSIVVALMIFSYGFTVNAQITQPLYYGYSNSSVSELQSNLKTLGLYNGAVNGVYDYNTYIAVKNFQSKYSLNVTGNLDLTTLNKLNKVLHGEPEILSYGITHDRVKELQTYLYSLGYLTVQPTGFYGSLTTTAVTNFQKNNGLSVTGKADKTTFEKLFQAIDNKFVPYTTYSNYTVASGDTLWAISQKTGVSQNDLIKANCFTTSTTLQIGQVIKIPKINVPVKPYFSKYAEYQDWFSAATYIFPIGTEATVIDFFSGKNFKVKRTIGSGHADCETLTASDTEIMKEIFGGKWTWAVRPIILVVNGRRLAASISGMPHAGLDAYPANVNVANRSDNYGYGPNYDYIKGNNMDGHFDIHFPGSLRHKDWQIDPNHQAMIKISANR